MRQDDSYYIRRFARITREAQIDALVRALRISPEQADIVLKKVIAEMKRQETLLSLAHQKREITEQEAKRIKEIKLLCIRKNTATARKEGRVHRLVRTKLFAEIDDLRKRNISWRKISEYIRKTYRHKIPYQTLHRVYSQLRKELFEDD